MSYLNIFFQSQHIFLNLYSFSCPSKSYLTHHRHKVCKFSNSSTNWHRKHSQATDLCPGKTSSLLSLLILNMMASNLLYGQFKTIQIASLEQSSLPGMISRLSQQAVLLIAYPITKSNLTDKSKQFIIGGVF